MAFLGVHQKKLEEFTEQSKKNPVKKTSKGQLYRGLPLPEKKEAAPTKEVTPPTKEVEEKKEVSNVLTTRTKKDKEPQKKASKSPDLLTFAFSQIAPLAIGGMIGGDAGAVEGFEKGQENIQRLRDEEQRQLDNDFRERRLEGTLELGDRRLAQQRELANARLGAKFAPKTTRQKLDDLGAEEKKRFDNVTSAIRSLGGLETAINKGVSRFSLIGDNEFTMNRELFTEAIQRMQSGAAITEFEAESFRGMLPTKFDDDDISRAKMKNLQEMMQARLATLGFTPDELGLSDFEKKQQMDEEQDRLMIEALNKRGIK